VGAVVVDGDKSEAVGRWGGGSRRELKAEINSKAAGESPRRFLRCSAPSSVDRLAAYVMICVRESSSSGRIRERRETPHEMRAGSAIFESRKYRDGVYVECM
jgi:hypothetical protein